MEATCKENPDSNDVGHSCYCNEGYKYQRQKRNPAEAVNDFSALGTDIGPLFEKFYSNVA